MGRLRLLFTLLAAAVVAVAAASSANADGAPLTLEISTAQRQCTAGSLASVAWSIRGGAEPYRLTINGEPIDPRAGSASVRCGEPPPDALRWLWSVSPAVNVEARVIDASGASAEAAASLTPAPPLPPPVGIEVYVSEKWGDYRRAEARAYVEAVERADRQSGRALGPSQRYIIRWRERGTRTWTYYEFGDRGSDWRELPPGLTGTLYFWQLDALQAGAFYQFQVSRVRERIERETPDALRWSPLKTVVTRGPPRDVTARATRDSISVSWRSNQQATGWHVSLTAHTPNAARYNYAALFGPFVAEKTVNGGHSPSVRFDGLLPGRVYTVQLRRTDSFVRPEALFDVRTEGVPDEADLAAHQPKIVRAEVEDGALQIEWLPPDAAPQARHRVTAREYGTWDHRTGAYTEAGMTSAALADFKPATTYRITVEALDGYGGRDERIVQTPPELSEDRAWHEQISTRLRVNWQTSGPRGAFHISWDPVERGEIAQVRWERDGRVMSSIGESPIVITVDQPGRYVFRARFRFYLGWSNWTEPAYATTKPPPPQIQVEERADGTRIWWESFPALTPIDGYRIYYERQGEPEQVFTVRDDTEITIPNEDHCGPHIVRIAAFNDELGEGSSSTWYTSRNRCGRVLVGFDARGAACDASRSTPTVVFWTIGNAVAPYTIFVQGHKPVQASGRHGWFRIYCQAEPEDGMHIIPVKVTDALGYSGTAKIELPANPSEDWRWTPWSVEIDALRAMNVEREEVRLSWHCWPWASLQTDRRALAPPKFLLRWRNAASPDWTYINSTATPMIGKVINGCHWTWTGLTPGTRYEFQLAAWLHSEELAAPELPRWSPLETVTTLGDARDVRIHREQGAVVVSWRAQPNAWAYQIVLRGADASWWKYYLPGGGDVERAVFVGAPPDGRYAVEIITPPRVAGEHPLEPGFIIPLPPKY